MNLSFLKGQNAEGNLVLLVIADYGKRVVEISPCSKACSLHVDERTLASLNGYILKRCDVSGEMRSSVMRHLQSEKTTFPQQEIEVLVGFERRPLFRSLT